MTIFYFWIHVLSIPYVHAGLGFPTPSFIVYLQSLIALWPKRLRGFCENVVNFEDLDGKSIKMRVQSFIIGTMKGCSVFSMREKLLLPY